MEGVDSKIMQLELRQDGKKGNLKEHEKGTKLSLGN